jgi:hypothetical protein
MPMQLRAGRVRTALVAMRAAEGVGSDAVCVVVVVEMTQHVPPGPESSQ